MDKETRAYRKIVLRLRDKQETITKQISKSKNQTVWNFAVGIWILFGICYLFFGASSARAANSSNFSIAVFVRPSAAPTSKAIVAKAEEMRLATDASGRPLCQIRSSAAWQTAVVSSDAIPAEAWSHIACAYDKVNLKIYINGEEKGSAALALDVDDTANDLRLGRDASSGSSYGWFAGLIDDFKFFNFSLDIDEVKTVYNQNSSLVVSSETGENSNGTITTGAGTEYCVPGDTALCDAPVLELKMDEMDGGTVYDTSGNGNNGTLQSGATWAPGRLGSGVRMDGINDTILCSNSLTFGGNSGTISYWFKDEGSPDGDFAVTYANNGFANLGLIYYYGSNSFSFTLGGNTETLNFDGDVWDSDWHHVEVTWGPDNYSRLYVDGVLNDEETTTLANPTVTSWRIGGSSNDTKGIFDEFRIFNYARTPAQIAWDYNQGKPVAEWRFDECQGGTIHDESGNGNHGTLNLGTSGTTATGTCASSSDSFWYNGRSGKYNSSGRFGGENWVNLGDRNDLEGMSQLTIMSWIKLDVLSSDFHVFGSWGGSANARYWLYHENLGTASNRANIWQFQVFTNSDATSEWVESSVVAEQDVWTHVAGVYNGSNLVLYINGVKDVGTVASGTPSGLIDSESADILLGARASYDTNPYGKIDEVKIFNYALTAEQVKLEYNNGAVRFGE